MNSNFPVQCRSCLSVCVFFRVTDNGYLQVVVADYEERQCPIGHDGQERSRDNAHHCTRNAICNLCVPCMSRSTHLL